MLKHAQKQKTIKQFLLSNDAFIRIGVLQSKIMRINKLSKQILKEINKINQWEIQNQKIFVFINRIQTFIGKIGFNEILSKCLQKFIILLGNNYPSAKIILVYYLTQCQGSLEKYHLLEYLKQVINIIGRNLQQFNCISLKCCIEFCRITQNQFDFSLVFQRCLSYLENHGNSKLQFHFEGERYNNQEENQEFECLILLYSIGSIKCIEQEQRKQYRKKLKNLIETLTKNQRKLNYTEMGVLSKAIKYKGSNSKIKGLPCSKLQSSYKTGSVDLQNQGKIKYIPPIKFKERKFLMSDGNENMGQRRNYSGLEVQEKKQFMNKQQKNSNNQSKQMIANKLRVVSKSFSLQIDGNNKNKQIKQIVINNVIENNNEQLGLEKQMSQIQESIKIGTTEIRDQMKENSYSQKENGTFSGQQQYHQQLGENQFIQEEQCFMEDGNEYTNQQIDIPQLQFNDISQNIQQKTPFSNETTKQINQPQSKYPPTHNNKTTKCNIFFRADQHPNLSSTQKNDPLIFHHKIVKNVVDKCLEEESQRNDKQTSNRNSMGLDSMLSSILKCNSIKSSRKDQLFNIWGEVEKEKDKVGALLETNYERGSLEVQSKINDKDQQLLHQPFAQNVETLQNYDSQISQISQIIQPPIQRNSACTNLQPYYQTSSIRQNTTPMTIGRSYKIKYFLRSTHKNPQNIQILGYFHYQNSQQSILVLALPFANLQNFNTVAKIIKNQKVNIYDIQNYDVISQNSRERNKKIVVFGVWNKSIENYLRFWENGRRWVDLQYVLFQMFYENCTFDALIMLYEKNNKAKKQKRIFEEIESSNTKHGQKEQKQRNVGKISLSKIDINLWYKLQCSLQQIIGTNIKINEKGLIYVNESPDPQDFITIIETIS